MEYQLFNRKIKFNIDKNIGRVLYIVEGQKREINLLGYIFKNILKYKETHGLDREGNERVKYVSEQNENSKIFIVNSEKSNIQSIKYKEFIENQVKKLKVYDEELNYEDIPVYYIFDCDRKKDQNEIEMLIKMFGNSREPNEENKYDSIAGMLLLSYPAIESFIISNFEKDVSNFEKRFDFNAKTLKEYIDDNKYYNEKMSIETLVNAFNELINSLDNIDINIDEINLDDVKDFNTNIFKYEKNHSNQYIVSLLLISFLDLGIIEFT